MQAGRDRRTSNKKASRAAGAAREPELIAIGRGLVRVGERETPIRERRRIVRHRFGFGALFFSHPPVFISTVDGQTEGKRAEYVSSQCRGGPIVAGHPIRLAIVVPEMSGPLDTVDHSRARLRSGRLVVD